MKGLIYPLVLAIGTLQPMQAGMLSTLRKGLDSVWLAGLCLAATQMLCFGTLFLVLRGPVPGWQQIAAVPWWAWFAGVLGVAVVFSMLQFAGQVGAGPFNGLVVTAAVISSLVLDHFGLFGFQEHAINLWRVVGGLLMAAGVVLIAIF